MVSYSCQLTCQRCSVTFFIYQTLLSTSGFIYVLRIPFFTSCCRTSYGFHCLLMYILFIHIVCIISSAHEIIKTLTALTMLCCPFKQFYKLVLPVCSSSLLITLNWCVVMLEIDIEETSLHDASFYAYETWNILILKDNFKPVYFL